MLISPRQAQAYAMNEEPLTRYRLDLQTRGFVHDPAQELAVQRLQQLYRTLTDRAPRKRRVAGFWPFRSKKSDAGIKGLYLWGGVGRGKTYLLDTFFEALPAGRAHRTHFHRFMREVHEQLTELRGEKNPLETVAARLRNRAEVLCFDEFFVSDITDAMILGGLLRALFARGTVLVATSNIHPDDLYKDGLQRDRFKPAIALMHEHMDILEIDSGADYRLRTLERANLCYVPLGAPADQALERYFRELVRSHEVTENAQLQVEGRSMQARYAAEDTCWFEFAELCEGPRSQRDYLVIASEYHTVLLSNVPVMGPAREDAARRFINLIDVLYDRRVKLILSCADRLEHIYQGQRLVFEFRRTLSRLQEMQSRAYLALPHLA